MEIICPISGEVLIKSNLFLGEDYAEIHPIFRVPRSKFICSDLVHSFSKTSSFAEKRIYFLAALNCTDLVVFNCPANPSVSTVEKHFLQIVQIAGWIDFAASRVGRGELSFPRFVVSASNADLSNIGHWLDAMEEIKTRFMKKDVDKERSRLLQAENQKLLKELSDAQLKDRLFTPFIADWILEVCALHEDKRAGLWKKMLTTKTGPKGDAWGLNRELLLELKELIVDAMIDTLSLKHPLVAPVLGQLNVLIKEQQMGLTDITIDMVSIDNEGSLMDGEEVAGSQSPTNRVAIDALIKDKFLAEFGSLEKPERKAGESLAKHIQAIARWKLAVQAAEKEISAPQALADVDALSSVELLSTEEQVLEHFNEEANKTSGEENEDV